METMMSSLRILTKGQITDLKSGFSLEGRIPFSVFVRAKTASMATNTLLNCKLILDKEAGAFPVVLGDWTPGVISVISPDGIDLEKYEVYWGAGDIKQP